MVNAGPEQAVTKTGVSVQDVVSTGGALPTGYTALPTTEVEVETAVAQRARVYRAAELQRQPLVATSEPATEPLRSTQAAPCRTEEGVGGGDGGGGGRGGANRSSIGFEMDDKTAEALGFGAASRAS